MVNSVVTEIRRKSDGGFETPVKLGAELKHIKSLLNSHNNNLEEQCILGLDCTTVKWTFNKVKYTTKKFYDGDSNHISNQGYYILFSMDYSDGYGTPYYFYKKGMYIPEYEASSAKFKASSTQDVEGVNKYFLAIDDMHNYTIKDNKFLVTDYDYPDFPDLDAQYYFFDAKAYFPEYDISNVVYRLDDDEDLTWYNLAIDDMNGYYFDEETGTLYIDPSYKIVGRDLLCFRTDLSNFSDSQIPSDIKISEKITSKMANDEKLYTKENIVNYF